MSLWKSEDQKYLLPVYDRMEIVIEKGEGCTLIDSYGNKYLDLFSGLAVNSLGTSPSKVKTAITDQIEHYLHLSNHFVSEPVVRLAKLLVENSFQGKVFFTNSGTEANEAALKLARIYGRMKRPSKVKVLSLEGSFHGRTYGSLTLTGKDSIKKNFDPLVPEITLLKFNDIMDLIDKVDEDVCAIFLEIIQGESGIHEIDKEWLEMVLKLRQEKDFLIVVDEIQTGLGRTGDPFAYEKFGFTPDLVTLAKSIGGGLPLGALLVKEEHAKVLTYGDHGSTFGGNPVSCAAGLASLEMILSPDFLKGVKARGYYLKMSLENLQKEFPTIIQEVRGRGLMLGLEVGYYADRIKALGLRKGLLLNVTNKTVLRLLPPLIITYEEIDTFLKGFTELLTDIEEHD